MEIDHEELRQKGGSLFNYLLKNFRSVVNLFEGEKSEVASLKRGCTFVLRKCLFKRICQVVEDCPTDDFLNTSKFWRQIVYVNEERALSEIEEFDRLVQTGFHNKLPNSIIRDVSLAFDDTDTRYFKMCLFVKHNLEKREEKFLLRNEECHEFFKILNSGYYQRLLAILAHKGNMITW